MCHRLGNRHRCNVSFSMWMMRPMPARFSCKCLGEDLAETSCSEGGAHIHHINVGTGTDVSIGELAGIIREVVGFEGDIRYDSSKPDGTPQKLLDVRRLSSLWSASFHPSRRGDQADAGMVQ